MIKTNMEIVFFFTNNILLILLLAVSILRVVPPEWVGYWKFNNNKESDGKAPRLTIINFILTSLFDSVFRAFFIPLIAALGLKSTVTLVILLVVVFDIFVRKQISGPAVTLVCVGIIALYLERLIETGEQIKLFGGFLTWNKEKPHKEVITKTEPGQETQK